MEQVGHLHRIGCVPLRHKQQRDHGYHFYTGMGCEPCFEGSRLHGRVSSTGVRHPESNQDSAVALSTKGEIIDTGDTRGVRNSTGNA